MNVNNRRTLKLLSNSVFAVNKITGLSSAAVLEILKDVFIKAVAPKYRPDPLKFGHGGTLDETATGVLVVGTGYGCKSLSGMLHGKKSYTVTGTLGAATDTYNETGSVTVEAAYDHITLEMLEAKLKQFEGRIIQTPPVYSALKRGGIRTADLARAGLAPTMEGRPVLCRNVRCTDFRPPHFRLELSCGPGFYVRSLVHDLGIALGSAAHVTALHRTAQGAFTEREALTSEHWTARELLAAMDPRERILATAPA